MLLEYLMTKYLYEIFENMRDWFWENGFVPFSLASKGNHSWADLIAGLYY